MGEDFFLGIGFFQNYAKTYVKVLHDISEIFFWGIGMPNISSIVIHRIWVNQAKKTVHWGVSASSSFTSISLLTLILKEVFADFGDYTGDLLYQNSSCNKKDQKEKRAWLERQSNPISCKQPYIFFRIYPTAVFSMSTEIKVSTFFALNLGGSMGSTGISWILTILWDAPELYWGPFWAGVYLMYWGAPGSGAILVGWAAWIFKPTTLSKAACVSFLVFSISSSSGLTRLCAKFKQTESKFPRYSFAEDGQMGICLLKNLCFRIRSLILAKEEGWGKQSYKIKWILSTKIHLACLLVPSFLELEIVNVIHLQQSRCSLIRQKHIIVVTIQ